MKGAMLLLSVGRAWFSERWMIINDRSRDYGTEDSTHTSIDRKEEGRTESFNRHPHSRKTSSSSSARRLVAALGQHAAMADGCVCVGPSTMLRVTENALRVVGGYCQFSVVVSGG